MKTFKNDLSTRQYKLYEYLKSQTDYKNLREIMQETNLYGDYSDSINCNGTRRLKKDIRALKSSGIIQYVILSTSKGIKLATHKEYESYSKRKWWAISRAILLQQTQDKKAGMDQQTRLTFGNEKDIVEAFI